MTAETLHRLIFSRLTWWESALCHCLHAAKEKPFGFQLKPQRFVISGVLSFVVVYCFCMCTYWNAPIGFLWSENAGCIFHEWETFILNSVHFSERVNLQASRLININISLLEACKQTGLRMILLVIWCSVGFVQSDVPFWRLARNTRSHSPHGRWLYSRLWCRMLQQHCPLRGWCLSDV